MKKHDEQYTGTYIAEKTVTLVVGSNTRTKKPESEWIRIPNHHPVIISKELFDRTQAVISIKGEPLRRRMLGTSERYAAVRQSPLKGKVVCGCCGHVMTLSVTKNSAFHCLFTRSASDAECHGFRVLKDELENTLFEIISKKAQATLGVDGLREVDTEVLQNTQQSECLHLIAQAHDQKRELYERFILSEIAASEYMNRKAEIDNELDRLNRAYTLLNEQIAQKQQEAETSAKLNEVMSNENNLSQSLVDTLIERVRIYPDNRIEIEWKITGMQDLG